ncbi:hypothetical protein [Pseudacidovorax sp. RU35E]|uniref:hypothetical protein n=1 Tax=Pseudacidovorax sp. RU35E TaxID=1907403 RepID=UPI000953BB7C|nr:hypothetical protein [Pseudacidovorax sp. RU35E]SIP97425.1 hypothetical protein SAMN05880557_101354 [Pseudacidovorax sp. RU35E]
MTTPLQTVLHRAAALALGIGALASGSALAESTYGYASSGTGTVTATARVNLSVTIPKLILLRVGSANTVVDTLSWTSTYSIPATPTVPVAGNNTAVSWDANAPTVTAGTQPTALSVTAWTNAGAGTINCSVATWSPATGGPLNSNFTITSTGTLPHPGANLGACASTSFPSNSLASSTWAYQLGGTPSAWTAGAYSTVVTYTATGV